MRALSIQVQPARSAGMDVAKVTAAFESVLASELVEHHGFNQGIDKGPYLNFTFGTTRAPDLWRLIRSRLYDDAELGPHMRKSSMAMCSSDDGWDDYALLYHFDPTVAVEEI